MAPGRTSLRLQAQRNVDEFFYLETLIKFANSIQLNTNYIFLFYLCLRKLNTINYNFLEI
jgi:hypothetical protein